MDISSSQSSEESLEKLLTTSSKKFQTFFHFFVPMPLKMITNRVMKDSELQQIIFFRKVKKIHMSFYICSDDYYQQCTEEKKVSPI